MARQANLLEDSPGRLMRKLSLPGILGMMVLSINSLIDSIYLGNLVSAEAFAGVSILFPITLIITSVTGFISAGSSSVLSRAIGADNGHKQRMIMPNLIALALLSSMLLTFMGLIFATQIVALLGAQDAIYNASVDYLQVYLYGLFFSIYGLCANGLIRAEGKMKQAMTYTVIAVVTNLVLTPLFISYFDLGIQGAAWSSICSMLTYSILTTAYFLRGNTTFEVGKFNIGFKKEIIGDVAAIGASSLAMQLSNVVRQFIVFRSVTWYGTSHDLIVFSGAFRLFSFISVPVMGLLQPLQPVVGVNFGANQWQRCTKALKTFRWAGILSMIVLVLPILLFPRWFMELLIPGEQLSIIELNNLRLIFFILPFLPISISAIIFFQAVGDGKKASFFPIARQVVLFLPLILVLPNLFGIGGIYYTLALENVFYALILWFTLSVTLNKQGIAKATADSMGSL